MSRPLLACLLCLLAGSATAQHGLQWGAPTAERTAQAQLAGWAFALRLHPAGEGQAPLRLLGDHYLTGPGFGGGRVTGGLRVSGGLAVDAWPPGLRQTEVLGPVSGAAVLPYIGLGYSSLSARAGWGFAADIGLGGLRPGVPVRFGIGGRAGGAVEQLLDELRLAPVLQLGVSYAF